jgi:mannose-1-phosphate guanylyltransferase
MQALVLVGGEGTRLRPLTLTRPKPAITLVDRPFIRFMVDWLARHGVSEVIMACGFRPDDLRSALGDSIPGGPAIRYLEEREALGTAGPIRLAADEGLLLDRFLVVNGDLLTDMDLTALLAAHKERSAVASLALHPVDDPTAYGLVRRDQDGTVRAFVEKPDPAEVDTDEVNAGAYVLERAVVDLIPPGRAVSIEREVFPRLVGQGLYGLRLGGYWMDIGTPERYLQASWDILTGAVETDVAARLDGAGVGIDEHAAVDAAAVLEGPALIESGAHVGAAAIGPRAVVGADCEVADGARVSGSVLHARCRVGAGAFVEDSILGAGVEVGQGAEIGHGSVIGEGARVEPRAVVEHDARLEPGGVAA